MKTNKAVVTVMGGVVEVFSGDVCIIDLDEWNDVDLDDGRRQEIISEAQRAGLRVVVYGYEGAIPNIQLFRPDQSYDFFINESIYDDENYVVYDPK